MSKWSHFTHALVIANWSEYKVWYFLFHRNSPTKLNIDLIVMHINCIKRVLKTCHCFGTATILRAWCVRIFLTVDPRISSRSKDCGNETSRTIQETSMQDVDTIRPENFESNGKWKSIFRFESRFNCTALSTRFNSNFLRDFAECNLLLEKKILHIVS